MKKINWLNVILIIWIILCLILVFNKHHKIQYSSDKDITQSLPDPDRPYYDAQGNKYDYQGKPINQTPIDNSNWGK